MDGWLKQSTAITLRIGPFLDSTDGNTAETALTITQAEVRLSKAGGDFAQKTETTSLVHDELGYYICLLDATDTGTLGMLKLAIHEAGALAVWHTWMVVPAQVWDSLFGADKLDVAVVEQANIDFGALQKTSLNAATPASVAGAVGSVAAGVTVTTNNDKTGYAIGTGGIAAAAFAAGAIDAAALATDAAAEIVDKLLGRNLNGGADGGRTVQDALRILRNKRSIAAGILTVRREDDITPAWTADVETAAGNPVSSIDPV